MVTKDYARRRGGCLTAWFIFQGIGVLFALIISLRGLSVSPIFILALLVLYAYVHLLRGIWNWKAWAVKSYAWVILLTNGLQVLFGIDPSYTSPSWENGINSINSQQNRQPFIHVEGVLLYRCARLAAC
jgi:hypothetical protein